jgi:iron-sulfur cluster repair protein YtfE (RIC family)
LQPTIHDILESDHRELDHLLDQLFVHLEGSDAEAIYRSLDLFWARLAMHIRAEHQRLFPALRDGISDPAIRETLPDLLARLREDHDFFMVELARAIKAARLVFYFGNESESFAIIRELVTAVKERLLIHNQIEESELYPLASEPLLSSEQIDDAIAGIRKELAKLPPRFARVDNGS